MSPQHSSQAQHHTFKGVGRKTPIERDYCDALERLANAAETVIELEFRGTRAFVSEKRNVEAMSEYTAAKESLSHARYRLEGGGKVRRNEHNERVMLAKLLSLEEEPEP